MPVLIKNQILTKLAISVSNGPIFKNLDTFPMFFGVRNWMDTLSKSKKDPKRPKMTYTAVLGLSQRSK